MLSKNERDFLQYPDKFSSERRRYLRWRIRRKLSILANDLSILTAGCGAAGIGMQEIMDAIEIQQQKVQLQNSATKAFDNSNTSDNFKAPADTQTRKDDIQALESW